MNMVNQPRVTCSRLEESFLLIAVHACGTVPGLQLKFSPLRFSASSAVTNSVAGSRPADSHAENQFLPQRVQRNAENACEGKSNRPHFNPCRLIFLPLFFLSVCIFAPLLADAELIEARCTTDAAQRASDRMIASRMVQICRSYGAIPLDMFEQ